MQEDKKNKNPHINLKLVSVATVKTRLLLKKGISALSLFTPFQRKVENEEIKCEKFEVRVLFCCISFLFTSFSVEIILFLNITSTPYLSLSLILHNHYFVLCSSIA